MLDAAKLAAAIAANKDADGAFMFPCKRTGAQVEATNPDPCKLCREFEYCEKYFVNECDNSPKKRLIYQYWKRKFTPGLDAIEHKRGGLIREIKAISIRAKTVNRWIDDLQKYFKENIPAAAPARKKTLKQLALIKSTSAEISARAQKAMEACDEKNIPV